MFCLLDEGWVCFVEMRELFVVSVVVRIVEIFMLG